MTTDHYPSVTIVAGEIRYIPGITTPLLRMHDGSVYIHITPVVARQWISELETIANEGINE